MDYLLSLVGKDQETITEAIKELAKNAEKVKIQEEKINDLQSELEDNKEEIHYLKNKLNQKYDLIEDMEYEIEKSEEKFEGAKKELGLKLTALENLITEQVDEINVLRKITKVWLVKLLKTFNWRRNRIFKKGSLMSFRKS